jgi:hypothetical protein
VARAQIVAGAFAVAEKAAAALDAAGGRAHVWVAIADGYAQRKADAEAVRALTAAATAVAEANPKLSLTLIPDSLKWWWGEVSWREDAWGVTPKEFLGRIAALQIKLGDPAAAGATLARVPPSLPARWVKLADGLSSGYKFVELDKALDAARESKNPSAILGILTGPAGQFGRNLACVQVLAERTWAPPAGM